MKLRRNNHAVAEIVGAMILLAIAVAAFSVIYLNILSNPGPSEETYVTLIGKMEPEGGITNTVAFENHRGEKLSLDTNINLEIGGPYGNHTHVSIKELSKTFPYLLDGWNIGEKFFPIIHKGDLTDVQIDATIIDKISNSIVFWGRLQEGWIAPPFGRGGIWHFDEPFWNGAFGEVKDSSGNNNHGTAKNGAKINTTISKSKNSGYFDGINDYVEVPSSYSLNITEAITIEAWIKPLEERSILETTKLDQKFGFTPYILRLSDKNESDNDELYAVVSEWQGSKGLLSIFNITNGGDTEFTGNDWTFLDNSGKKRNILPVITKITDEMYIIAYQFKDGNDARLYTKLVNINASGKITPVGNGSYFSGSNIDSNRPSIIRISNEICAIVYRASNNTGILRTITILSDGTISLKNTFYFGVSCFEPEIINVSGNIYAIVYRDSIGLGFIKTVNITSEGIITDTKNIFFFSNCYEPDIISVSGEIYAIAYHNLFSQGTLKTVKILSNDGSIYSTNQMLTFESTNECHTPSIVQHSKNVYFIAYATGHNPGDSDDKDNKAKGYFITVEIFDDGSFGTIVQPRTVFEESRCFDPMAIKISNRIFAVVYEGKWIGVPPNDHPGALVTVLTEDTTPVYTRGVVRAGAAAIYAQWKKGSGTVDLLACINTSADDGVIITAQITPNIWHHIVLTFDGSKMCLYNDTFKIDEKSVGPYIYIPKNNLRFGNIFYGYLDEIAIFDRALTEDIIQEHFANPGIFETIFYRDADGDGYGNPAVSVQTPSAPVGYVSDNNDCDDTKSSVHPGATEICFNSIDDDCDGQVDENCLISTAVNPITSPIVTSSPYTITATGNSLLDSVVLWFRWSDDGISWDGGLDEVKDPVDSNTCDVDSSADKGTETDFGKAQGIYPDGNIMTIQEADKGWSGGSENLNVNNFDNMFTQWIPTGSTPYLDADDTANVKIGGEGGNPDGKTEAWFNFPDTSGPDGAAYSISLYVKAWGDGNDWVNPYMDWTGGSGTDKGDFGKRSSEGIYDSVNLGSSFTKTQVNAMRLKLIYTKSGQANYLYVDYAYLVVSWAASSNYNIDFEYQWTPAVNNMVNEQVCVYVGSHTGSENLLVNYWTGSTWSSLGAITNTGWFNFTATGLMSSTYTIQLKGASDSSDTSLDSWNIDVIMLRTWNNTGGQHGVNWMIWSNANNPDTNSPWIWYFNFPKGPGYYEFYSIGKYGVITEAALSSADATCLFNPS